VIQLRIVKKPQAVFYQPIYADGNNRHKLFFTTAIAAAADGEKRITERKRADL